jgi:hypothetical protein
VVRQAAVSLQVNVAKANHFRAGLNMALAGAVIVLLLAFVVHLNLTIWKVSCFRSPFRACWEKRGLGSAGWFKEDAAAGRAP